MSEPRVLGLKLSGRPPVAVGIPMSENLSRNAFWNFMFLAKCLRATDAFLPIYATAVPATARNTIITTFLTDPEHAHCRFLCLFDSDMIVPMNVVEILAGYDLPFVSAYCTRKSYPYLPIPAMLVGTSQQDGELTYEYTPITSWEPNSNIHECDGVGAAALCLRRDLLEAMERPWFKHEGGGEDYYFCRKVKQTRLPAHPDGVPIYVDTNTTVGHIGEAIAWPADFFRIKEGYMAETGKREIDIERTA
jgi:hypothetical protein